MAGDVTTLRTMRNRARRIGGWLSLVLVAGCATAGVTSQQALPLAPLQTAVTLKFSDVPVPVGFDAIENESFAFQNEATRVGLVKYWGRPSVDRVVQFYREQMPRYHWALLNVLEYESRILNFEKTDQTCIVTIGRRGDRTQVTIALAPKSGAIMAPRQASGGAR